MREVRAVVAVILDGTGYQGPLRGYSNATGSFSGTTFTMDTTLRAPGDPTNYVIHIVVTTSATSRPSALISGVSAIETECQRFSDGFIGSEIVATGGTSNGVGTWTLATSGGTFVSSARTTAPPTNGDLSPVTLRVSLLTPGKPLQLSYASRSSGYVLRVCSTDRRSICG
jgi:hypothetical protein